MLDKKKTFRNNISDADIISDGGRKKLQKYADYDDSSYLHYRFKMLFASSPERKMQLPELLFEEETRMVEDYLKCENPGSVFFSLLVGPKSRNLSPVLYKLVTNSNFLLINNTIPDYFICSLDTFIYLLINYLFKTF